MPCRAKMCVQMSARSALKKKRNCEHVTFSQWPKHGLSSLLAWKTVQSCWKVRLSSEICKKIALLYENDVPGPKDPQTQVFRKHCNAKGQIRASSLQLSSACFCQARMIAKMSQIRPKQAKISFMFKKIASQWLKLAELNYQQTFEVKKSRFLRYFSVTTDDSCKIGPWIKNVPSAWKQMNSCDWGLKLESQTCKNVHFQGLACNVAKIDHTELDQDGSRDLTSLSSHQGCIIAVSKTI